jgi:hypothetical protein
VFRKDAYLKERWLCGDSKLWRMRKAGELNSIQLRARGPWITSDEEIQRIESQPRRKSELTGIAKKLAEAAA